MACLSGLPRAKRAGQRIDADVRQNRDHLYDETQRRADQLRLQSDLVPCHLLHFGQVMLGSACRTSNVSPDTRQRLALREAARLPVR